MDQEGKYIIKSTFQGESKNLNKPNNNNNNKSLPLLTPVLNLRFAETHPFSYLRSCSWGKMSPTPSANTLTARLAQTSIVSPVTSIPSTSVSLYTSKLQCITMGSDESHFQAEDTSCGHATSESNFAKNRTCEVS